MDFSWSWVYLSGWCHSWGQVTIRRDRDEISSKIEGMTLEEELEWLASQDLTDPLLERFRKNVATRSGGQFEHDEDGRKIADHCPSP